MNMNHFLPAIVLTIIGSGVQLMVQGLQLVCGIEAIPQLSLLFDSSFLSLLLEKPAHIYELLRIQATQDYGLARAITISCTSWSKMGWKVIEELVYQYPGLGLKLFWSNGVISLRGTKFYKRIEHITGLPPVLEQNKDVELLLKNLPRIEELDPQGEYRINGPWLQFETNIARLLKNPTTFILGLSHRIFFKINLRKLFDETLQLYSFLLNKLTDESEISGHLAFLQVTLSRNLEIGIPNKFYMYLHQTIDFLEKKCKQCPHISNTVTSWESLNLKSLGPEAFRHIIYKYIDPSALEGIPKIKELINEKLSGYETYDFYLLVELLGACRQKHCGHLEPLLSKENRQRLVNIRFDVLTSPATNCLTREDRLAYFHRWERRIPQVFLLLYDYTIQELLYSCPDALPHAVEGYPSIQQYLQEAQVQLWPLVKKRLSQWEYEGTISIRLFGNLEWEETINEPNIWDYLYYSALRQVYFASTERFHKSLASILRDLPKRFDDERALAINYLVRILHPKSG